MGASVIKMPGQNANKQKPETCQTAGLLLSYLHLFVFIYVLIIFYHSFYHLGILWPLLISPEYDKMFFIRKVFYKHIFCSDERIFVLLESVLLGKGE